MRIAFLQRANVCRPPEETEGRSAGGEYSNATQLWMVAVSAAVFRRVNIMSVRRGRWAARDRFLFPTHRPAGAMKSPSRKSTPGANRRSSTWGDTSATTVPIPTGSSTHSRSPARRPR
jgi:hypothetical protein